MQADQGSLVTRDDTLLGVCAALGEDFGFNPVYLRVTLGVMLIWSPVAVLVGYIAAGLVVAASRWTFPNARAEAVEQAETASHHDNDDLGFAVAA